MWRCSIHVWGSDNRTDLTLSPYLDSDAPTVFETWKFSNPALNLLWRRRQWFQEWKPRQHWASLCSLRMVTSPWIDKSYRTRRGFPGGSVAKNLPATQEIRVWSLCGEDHPEKEMANSLSILTWKVPWTEEPGRLQSVGSLKIGHDWVTELEEDRTRWRWSADLPGAVVGGKVCTGAASSGKQGHQEPTEGHVMTKPESHQPSGGHVADSIHRSQFLHFGWPLLLASPWECFSKDQAGDSWFF